MIRLAEDRSVLGPELRTVVVDTLRELMGENESVVALDADLGGASGWTKLIASNPDRFIQCGIAEANMVGVAAGMSSEGFTPFIHSFAPFITRRVFDQIYMSGAYAGNTVNIYGSDPGFTAATNGGTHTSYEDVALMRCVPGATVCDAADAVQMAWIVREYAGRAGINYFRGNRKAVRNVYAEGSTFEIGKGNLVREGSDALVVSAGQILSEALDAAEALAADGVDTAVIDMFCIKPLDKDLLVHEAAGKKLVVVFENHNVNGGLGEACASALMEAGVAVPFARVGVDERFGQVGPARFLQEEYGLTAGNLERVIREKLGGEA